MQDGNPAINTESNEGWQTQVMHVNKHMLILASQRWTSIPRRQAATALHGGQDEFRNVSAKTVLPLFSNRTRQRPAKSRKRNKPRTSTFHFVMLEKAS
jgi:hypothetical protein